MCLAHSPFLSARRNICNEKRRSYQFLWGVKALTRDNNDKKCPRKKHLSFSRSHFHILYILITTDTHQFQMELLRHVTVLQPVCPAAGMNSFRLSPLEHSVWRSRHAAVTLRTTSLLQSRHLSWGKQELKTEMYQTHSPSAKNIKIQTKSLDTFLKLVQSNTQLYVFLNTGEPMVSFHLFRKSITGQAWLLTDLDVD